MVVCTITFIYLTDPSSRQNQTKGYNLQDTIWNEANELLPKETAGEVTAIRKIHLSAAYHEAQQG